jgi:hypothetical protein
MLLVVKVLRMTGHAIAFVAPIFIVSYIMSKGVPDIIASNGLDVFIFLPFFAFTILGCVVAYFYPIRGAAMVITGGFLMLGYQILFSNLSLGIVFGLPFIISAVMIFLGSGKSHL